MNDDLFLAMIPLFMGALALGFDSQVARAMSWYSAGVGELFREHRVWGALVNPPDPRLAYRNHLFFVRFWGAAMSLFGIGLGITLLFRR